ncbi:MAG: TonB-dependent receptor [Thiobacillaceae bacterium]|nr:TonB-dependent receptor [Thiobacillaceae bacterium]
MSLRPHPLSTAVLLACALPALGAQRIPELTEVRVIAPRPVPPLQELVRGEAIDGLLAATSDSASLLRALPGGQVRAAGGNAGLPVIRGLADERLRISVDGMDLLAACPNHMNPALSYIDPTRVEAIEVYAGVAPVSAGGDAIGATVRVSTTPPALAPAGVASVRSAEAGAFYRSNGDGRGVNLRAAYGTERLAVAYDGAYARSDNYKAGKAFKNYDHYTGRQGHSLARDEVGSSRYETANHALSLAWRHGDSLVDVRYLRQQTPFQGYPNQRMDMTDNTSDKLSLALHSRHGWGSLKAQAYYEHIDHAMQFGPDKRYWYGMASGGPNPPLGAATPCAPIGPTCAAGMPMLTEGRNYGLTLGAELPLGEADKARLGAEYRSQWLNDWWPPSGSMMWPGTFWNIREGERDRYALYAEWEGRRGAWTHILGLRHETVQMDAGPVQGYKTNLSTPPNPGVDVGNQIAESTAFNAQSRQKTDHNWDLAWLMRFSPVVGQTYELGLARKTRSPGLYERYTWSTWQMAALMNNFTGDGNGYVGNLKLKPEVAYTLSAAAEWRTQGWTWRLAPYYSRVEDYIDAVCIANCVPNNFRILRYANHDATLYGLEISTRGRLGRAFDADLGFEGSMSYTRGKNDTTGDNLYDIMPLNAKLALTQTRGAWSWRLEGEFVDDKDKVSNVRQEMRTAGYALAHLRLSYRAKPLRVDFGIENLFDRGYDLPLGGAYVGQGTTMTLPPVPNQPQWGTPVPGPGRNLYLGLNWTL